MDFAAVRRFFKPVSGTELDALALKNGGSREQSVCLEDVGIDFAAREAQAAQACTDAFEMGMRQAHVAWTGTPMLARVVSTRAEQVRSTLCEAGSAGIAEMMSDIVGASFSSQAMTMDLDAGKAAQLGQFVLQAAAASVTGAAAQDRLASLKAAMLGWIRRGDHEGAPDLARINELIGGRAQLRLAIAAPFAPALAVCELVLRALDEHYPFRPAGPQGAANV